MIRAMNMEAQHRKKDPVRLHKQLLESAATIAGRDGIASLSLNAVAREAGVSKGGLLHHFPQQAGADFRPLCPPAGDYGRGDCRA